MKISKVAIAAAEYAKGNYSTALEIYKYLGRELGESYFAVNIKLCQRRMKLAKTECRDVPVILNQNSTSIDLNHPHSDTDNLSGKQKDSLFQNMVPYVFIKSEAVDLPQQDPLWFEVQVISGQTLVIEAVVEYKNTGDVVDRKAILLINGFNSSGELIKKSCGRMSKSDYYKAFFKYLPCTKNKLQELHTFKVPNDVVKIKIGLCGFNKKESENIIVRELLIRPNSNQQAFTQFVPPSSQAAEIGILGWPEYSPNGKPYVVGIMDEFTTGCFEQDVNLIQPRPDNWFALAEKYSPSLFFIESAWKGNFGSWQYRVADYSNKPGQEVVHICQYAREKGIPTLFWNKEDPEIGRAHV